MYFGYLFKFISTNCGSQVFGHSARQTRYLSSPSLQSNMSKAAVLIFLHGRGGSGESWRDEMKSVLPAYVKCICPDAPIRPITISMGMQMPAWFDRISSNSLTPEDGDGVKESCTLIHNMIEEQEKLGISHERILLGGFSQGGAMALYSALKYPKRLAGVIAMSCWLPLSEEFPGEANDMNVNKTTPTIQCHGTHDDMIRLAWIQSDDQVNKMRSFLGENYNFKTYTGLGHDACSEEMNDIKNFIARCLSS